MSTKLAKLFFIYSAMNAGKTTHLLQIAHNYEEQEMNVLLLTAAIDTRYGEGVIGSRIGLQRQAHIYTSTSNLLSMILQMHSIEKIDCVLVDECQFLKSDQVDALAEVVDEYKIPVMCFGLRTDFQGNLFEGSHRLLALSDEIREIKTICWCGKKANMVLRIEQGSACANGAQIEIGGNSRYQSVCRKHWKAKVFRRSDRRVQANQGLLLENIPSIP